ncbi:hypothetical protein D9M70_643320 [compost metagenome]
MKIMKNIDGEEIYIGQTEKIFPLKNILEEYGYSDLQDMFNLKATDQVVEIND